ncbi:MAG: hypothetical protein AB1349_11660 [Elusimicrobiota bacterium]
MHKAKQILPVLVLFVLVLVFFYKIVFFKKIFITGDLTGCDILDLAYPFRHFLSQSLNNKTLPLWCSYNGCGFPIHAVGEGGFFYPLNLLLFSLLPPITAFNWNFVVTSLIAGVSFYSYTRYIGLSVFAALLGSVVFTFSSFLVGHIRHINMINTACWLPLLFLTLKLFFDTGKNLYAVLTGAILGIQILAGFPQVFYYSLLAGFVYSLYLFIITKKQSVSSPYFLHFILLILIVFVIMSGLGAVQWLPSYEMFKLSSYIELPKWYDYFGFKDLIMLVLPYFYGNPAEANLTRADFIPWESCVYVGIIPLLLSIIVTVVWQISHFSNEK